jgi:hypothetical protein
MKAKHILVIAGMLLMIAACSKQETRLSYFYGWAPILSSTTSDTLVLQQSDRNSQALNLNWTNPRYLYTNGVASQTVSYSLLVDTIAAFTSAVRQEISLSATTRYLFTVDELNKLLTRMGLEAGRRYPIFFRIRSSINNAVPLQSGVLRKVVTSYEDFAVPPPSTGELYITGDATPSGWTNAPPATQRLTRVNNGEYYIDMAFAPGLLYKFLSHQNQWQPQYGGNSQTGGEILFNLGTSTDPPGIETPPTAGNYRVTLDFRLGRYTVVQR